MTRFELLKAHVLAVTGLPLESQRPRPVTGWEAVEAVWPLNERFRPNIHQIRSMAYDPAFEQEADQAIEAMVLRDDDWGTVSAGAWRVLLERQQQGIIVALLTERNGTPLMSEPEGLRPEHRPGVVAAFLLHSTPLPWPAEDRSTFALPVGAVPASLRRH